MYPLVVDTVVWESIGGSVGNGLSGSMCAIRKALQISEDLSGFGELLAQPIDPKTNISSSNGIKAVKLLSNVTVQDLSNSSLGLNQQTATNFRQRGEGWRWEWLIKGMEAERNYTVWVVGNSESGENMGRGRIYGLIWMKTKEG